MSPGPPGAGVPIASVYGWEQIPDLFRGCAALGVEGIVLEETTRGAGRKASSARSVAMQQCPLERSGEDPGPTGAEMLVAVLS